MTDIDAKYGDVYDPQEYCEHEWTIVKLSPTVYEGHCEKCGLVTTEILHVKYWHENEKEDPYIRIRGKQYRALKAWGNIAPCAECGKIFFEIPLIVWDCQDRSKAIVFCGKCTEQILEGIDIDAGYVTQTESPSQNIIGDSAGKESEKNGKET